MTAAWKQAYDIELRRVAKRLGLPLHGDLETAIIKFCEARVEHWLEVHGQPDTMTELLQLLATCLEVEIAEIHGDEDLRALLRRLPPSVEPAMAGVEAELTDDIDGIMVRRMSPQPWERPFIAIINCRGWHGFRRFFTKWHEIAHLLVDGQQLRFAFRRTRAEHLRRDPEEVLVDRLAGALAFHPAIFGPALRDATAEAGGLTFEAAEVVRAAVAPEASRQSVILACVRQSTEPVYFLRCRLEYKREELRRLTSAQLDLFSDERTVPERQLRVIEAAGSPSAADKGFRVHQNMRVPDSSLVAHAFQNGLIAAESGRERLDRWETSSGGPIGEGWIDVDTHCFEDEVWACFGSGGPAAASYHRGRTPARWPERGGDSPRRHSRTRQPASRRTTLDSSWRLARRGWA